MPSIYKCGYRCLQLHKINIFYNEFLNVYMFLQLFIGFIFQLRRAVVDHVSDSFLETTMPLIMMIEAAQAGNEREVEECAKLFTEHAAKLEEVRFWQLNPPFDRDYINQTRKCKGGLVTGEEQ